MLMATTASNLNVGFALTPDIRGGGTRAGSTEFVALRSPTGLRVPPTEALIRDIAVPVSGSFEAEPRELQRELPEAELPKRIKAVAARVDGPLVAISLQLPAGPMEISVAADIVPAHLSVYGTTVWISLDDTDGYKRLVVTDRRLETPPSSQQIADLERRLSALK
jgi:hypothetical protein